MKMDPSLETKLRKLLGSQKFGVLATQQRRDPYTSLISFACSEDMRQIVFATPMMTRKYANIVSNPRVSFFIDNRSNKAKDFKKGIGVTALGSVRLISKNKNSKMMKLYLAKHPHLESFVRDASCAFVCIDVRSFYIVQRFGDVCEVHFK